MKTNKLKILLPILLVIFISFVQASSVTVFLLYNSTIEDSLTIYDGDQVGFIVSADSILESSMTVQVDLLNDSGDVIANLIDVYTTSDEYYTSYVFGKDIYGEPENYTIKATVTAASGQTDTTQLFLEVILPAQDNNPPVISSTPFTEINEGAFYNYLVIATDADEDTLTYSLTQNPDWISINPDTGLITGTAPLLDSDYEYRVTVEVSDGIDFDSQFFTLLVKNIDDSTEEDTTSPVLTIIYPEDGETYSSHVTFIQYTVFDENLATCEYSIDEGQTRIEVICGEIITGLQSTEGENTWTVYATDNFENQASANITFNVEITDNGDDNDDSDDNDGNKDETTEHRAPDFFYRFEKLEDQTTPILYLNETKKTDTKTPILLEKRVIWMILLILLILIITEIILLRRLVKQ